ncbi:MAG: hypothetical protein AAF385_01990 [Pseudomonadota bacterium]
MNTSQHKHKGILSAGLLTLSLILGACGDSSGAGGGIGFGDGQTPDPVALDFPIVYVKRPVTDEDGNLLQSDVRNIISFNIGADLFLRDRASPSTPDVNLTEDLTQGLGDIRDVDISYDGTKVLFAMRAQFIEGADEDDQPTWNIWEYDNTTQTTRRLITSDITAEAGHDISPHYMPDGRIVFTSSRQRRSVAILLDEGKPQYAAQDEDGNEPAFVLHIMDTDGTNIEQISFNQSHDYDPFIMSNGQIGFSRWDHAGPNNAIHLYRVNPDGSGLEMLYGSESHATGTGTAEVQFLKGRELPNGDIMTLIRPFSGTGDGGDIVTIDIANYLNITQANRDNIGVLNGPAQASATTNEVLTADDQPSPGGRYSAVYPLSDGTDRLLVSWSQCRLTDGTRILPCTDDNLSDSTLSEADPIYGIWIYDRIQNTQLPVVVPEEGFQYTEIVAGEQRTPPPVIVDGINDFTLDSELTTEGAGILHIRSVYDFDGVDLSGPGIDALADPQQFDSNGRAARFIRITKPVSMPDDDVLDFDNSAFGVTQAFGMNEVLGYAPVEPDGSVMVKVPANVALSFDILDANGRAFFARHNNWLQVVPGEFRECSGCHDAGAGTSHGRADAFFAVNDGANADGQPFPNTNPAIFADFGETMAEARARISCGTDNCSSLETSFDIIFDDVWTDPALRAPDASFAYLYQDLVTPLPIEASCATNWTALCRSVIHYEENLHPLWAVPRTAISDQAILDAAGAVIDTCLGCHAPADANGAAMVPAGQLDLTDGASDIDPDHFKAYRELLSGDNEQELDAGGNLVDRMVQNGVDVDGNPIFVTVPVARSMAPGRANASNRFFSRFAAGGAHAGYLSDAELKLLSEWLDGGAQYYNNPFEAPLN